MSPCACWAPAPPALLPQGSAHLQHHLCPSKGCREEKIPPCAAARAASRLGPTMKWVGISPLPSRMLGLGLLGWRGPPWNGAAGPGGMSSTWEHALQRALILPLFSGNARMTLSTGSINPWWFINIWLLKMDSSMLFTSNHRESCKLGNFTEVFGFLVSVLSLYFTPQNIFVLCPNLC